MGKAQGTTKSKTNKINQINQIKSISHSKQQTNPYFSRPSDILQPCWQVLTDGQLPVFSPQERRVEVLLDRAKGSLLGRGWPFQHPPKKPLPEDGSLPEILIDIWDISGNTGKNGSF